MRQRQVLAADSARGDGLHQRIHDGTGARHYHQSTGVLVQAVHNAGPWQHRSVWIESQKGIEQRAAPVARGWVHHQTGRFVDDQQVLITEHNSQRDGLWLERLALQRWTQLNAAVLPCLDPRGRFSGHDLLERYCSAFNKLLEVTPGKFGHEFNQRLIKPQAMLPL